MPKRAGLLCFRELVKFPEEEWGKIAAARGIYLKRIPVRLLGSDLIEEAGIIRAAALEVPKGRVLQGVMGVEGDSLDMFKLSQHIIYPSDKSKGVRVAMFKLKASHKFFVAAYSKEDDILSYLYGDEGFTVPHWFVDDSPSRYRIPDSVEVLQPSNEKELLELRNSLVQHEAFPQRTQCVFISGKDLEGLSDLRKSYPEMFWTRVGRG
jgi:hypothetical protein